MSKQTTKGFKEYYLHDEGSITSFSLFYASSIVDWDISEYDSYNVYCIQKDVVNLLDLGTRYYEHYLYLF